MASPMEDPRTDPSTASAGLGGLSSGEAEARRRRGEVNGAISASWHGYARIVRTNVFNLYNTILFTIGAGLLVLGRYNDAVISAGIGVLNAGISAVQEIRTRRQLDQLQVLARHAVVVVRDGSDREVLPDDVVRGDVLRVSPGDQVVVDGPVLAGAVTVDESLLTGESEAQVRTAGQDLLSGSHCVAGGGLMLARDVGAASYANQLTTRARRGSTDATPLQRQIAFCIRLVMVLVVLMAGAIVAQAALEGLPTVRVVQIAAVLSGLVPYGLFFLIVLAYTAGAVASSRRGALVQRVNAVDSLSNVDVICTDKTGTLTTGRLAVAALVPSDGHDAREVAMALGSMARSTAAGNLTSAALAAHLPGSAVAISEEIPFSSALRFGAVRAADATWVLGAPEALMASLAGPDLTAAVRAHTAQGLRVLLFARATDPAAPLRDAGGDPVLPRLEPLALVALADQLRPDLPETMARYRRAGIAVKILSGDDPDTVAAVAHRAGLRDGDAVHGAQLHTLSDAQLDAVVATSSVFGRVAPEQKERIVVSLRRQGRYVAMVGDGVNDARALKAAHVGVAMGSGSAVTRDVADIVLVEDSFDVLLPTRQEGRRIIAGIAISAQLFFTRVVTQALIIVTVTMLGLGFPYSPAQTGLTLFTVGLPAIFLTAWASPSPPDRHLLRTLAGFVLPAAVVTAGFAVAVYAYLYTFITQGFSDPDVRARIIAEFDRYPDLPSSTDPAFADAAATLGAQTGLSTFVSLASILLILFLSPPTRILAVWTRPTSDKRPAVLVAALLVALVAALVVPALSTYFGLTRPAPPVYDAVLPTLGLWFVTLAATYRFHLFDRALALRDVHES